MFTLLQMTAIIEALYRPNLSQTWKPTRVTSLPLYRYISVPIRTQNEIVTAGCDVTRVLPSKQGYYNRYMTFIPRASIATELDEHS